MVTGSSAGPLWKSCARTYVPLPRNAARTGTSQRPNSRRRGSKAARNSSIPTAKPTPKLSENRTSSVCVSSGRRRERSHIDERARAVLAGFDLLGGTLADRQIRAGIAWREGERFKGAHGNIGGLRK